MLRSVTSFAPGRVCLLGDKNDLLSGPVVAATISKYFKFNLSEISEPKIRFSFPDISEEFERPFDRHVSHPFFKFFSRIAWRLKDRIHPFECTVSGDLPIGSGLSSSAACSVGLLRGLNDLFSLKMNNYEIAEFAYDVEHNDLGIMCGRMDQYSIACGGVTYIETGHETKVRKIDKISSLPLVIGDSCEPRKAMGVLNRTMDLIKNDDPHILATFKMIDANVKEGIKAIEKLDLAELGARMCIHQGLERSMQASTKKLDAMCDAAMEHGALGAKQIGAGGGGCMIALCHKGGEKIIMNALKKLNANVWQADLQNQDQ